MSLLSAGVRAIILTVLALLISSLALSDALADDYVEKNYTKHEYMVPMRDGVKLYTQVYVPTDRSREYGIIFERTSYGVGAYGDDEIKTVLGPNPYYARAGFIFVYQDIRGTFMSGGEFSLHRPFVPGKSSPSDVDESSDAYDTVDWLLRNVPSHNGRVMLWGTSYSGWLAVMSLLEPHPALVAVLPQAPPIDMWLGDDLHHNGAFRLMYAFAWTSSHARVRPELMTESHPPFDYGTPDGYRFFLELGALGNADDQYFNGAVPAWNELMEHGNYDDYWLSRNPLRHLKRLEVPVLIVAGWFDGEDFYGPMNLYRVIEERFPDNDCRLVVGPWRHSGWNWMDGDTLGELRFGSKTGDFFRAEIEYPFFARHLNGQEQAEPPEAMVFETGANEWRLFDAWPPEGTTDKKLFLLEDGNLGSQAPKDSGNDSFLSDPAKPVPWSPEIRATQGHRGLYEDQRFAASRPDVLVYESEVLKEDIAIAGPVAVTLYASTTGTDADWIVKLIDVFPGEGELGHHQMLLAAEVFRSKYRNSFSEPEPLVPKAVTKIRFELPDRFHRFLRGHRMMVQVQSTWFPVVDRNPQTFVDIYAAREDHFQKAVHRVYRTPKHPSHVTVRVLKP